MTMLQNQQNSSRTSTESVDTKKSLITGKTEEEDSTDKMLLLFKSTNSIMSNKKLSNLRNSGRARPFLAKRRATSEPTEDPYGWFEDFESSPLNFTSEFQKERGFFTKQPLHRSLSLPGSISAPPFYVLESSLETQLLWYVTAGQRPRQPEKERKYFETLWAQNFENSAVQYSFAKSETESIASISDNYAVADKIPKSEFDGEILYRGRGSFSNSVSKSFEDVSTTQITIQIPRFRVVKLSGSVHAEFLNVVSLGSKNTITFGIWRRHSDFLKLAKKVEEEDAKSQGSFRNTMLSWQCVLQRKRWFRCLDKDYLALKCFLLERFVHDLLFESQTPNIISDFLGLD